jgi:hypothetical protein
MRGCNRAGCLRDGLACSGDDDARHAGCSRPLLAELQHSFNSSVSLVTRDVGCSLPLLPPPLAYPATEHATAATELQRARVSTSPPRSPGHAYYEHILLNRIYYTICTPLEEAGCRCGFCAGGGVGACKQASQCQTS